VGNPGIIKYLKNMGFKTFDKWWDESYDNCEDTEIRIDMIVSELKRLSYLSDDELLKLRIEIDKNVNYNQILYRSYHAGATYNYTYTSVYDKVQKIWDKF